MKEDEDDEVILICARVAGNTQHALHATQEDCAECERPVWVSPASAKAARAQSGTFKAICMECAEVRLRTDDKPDLMPPTAEQMEEIVEALKQKPQQRFPLS